MGERITDADIDKQLRYLNNLITESGLEVHHGKRYNYNALDVYTHNGKLLDTIETGMTKKETYNTIWHLIKGIELYTHSKY